MFENNNVTAREREEGSNMLASTELPNKKILSTRQSKIQFKILALSAKEILPNHVSFMSAWDNLGMQQMFVI